LISILILFLDFLQTRFPLSLLGVREARISGFKNSGWIQKEAPRADVVWFHASSMGELEMLRPLIDDFIQAGKKTGVSVFSDSALAGLRELEPVCVYAGLSPRETGWKKIFSHFRVSKVILAKYDFWPGMISAAQGAGAPVIVINALNRPSLRLARFVFPRMAKDGKFHLFGTGAGFLPGVDPRWERVARRLERGPSAPEKKDRIAYWKGEIANLPRPIGVIGSAWPEDLEVVLQGAVGFQGSLLVVPHSFAPDTLARIRHQVSRHPELAIRCVEEIGILVELYSEADFAFVGGGFGKGIHSTLEPAVSGIPVAAGPSRFESFPEALELEEAGVLRRIRSPSEFAEWLRERVVQKGEIRFLSAKRKQYRALLVECLRIG
jgi:3-deoxy-D-manno-octulosonic-acid transferase